MTGTQIIIRSSSWWAGFRRGHRTAYARWPGWKLLTAWLLTVILLGSSVAVTVTAFEIALRSASIGEIVQQTIIGKWLAWIRIYKLHR